MPGKMKTITLPLPLGMGTVNCYLIQTEAGFILIDTGISGRRTDLERMLTQAGCLPGNFKLILITHGDFDHIGNAAYLRSKFGAPVAIHRHDSAMAETGNMFASRKTGNVLLGWISSALFGFGKSKRFTPDVLVDEGMDLSNYGLEAEVVSIPGHSKGSIGVLTTSGDLYCGDLLDNVKKPAVNTIMDDPEAAQTSLMRLRGLGVKAVYPGHGEPFTLEEII